MKPFGTICFGVTKPKLNFLATTKAIAEKNTWPNLKLGSGSIMLWGLYGNWATGNVVWVVGRKDSTICRILWAIPDIDVYCEVGYSIKTMIPKHTSNQPWSTSRKDRWRVWNGHHSPQTSILLFIFNMFGDRGRMPEASTLKTRVCCSLHRSRFIVLVYTVINGSQNTGSS